MLKWRVVTLLAGCGLLVLGLAALNPSQLFAQADLACTDLAERALTEVGQNCGGLGRNEACYGYNRVGAEFNRQITEDVFSLPSDTAGLAEMTRIETAPLDEQLATWGIAVMNVQANIPNTLPGQNVVFILVGDTQVDNQVPAEEAALPSDVVIPLTLATNGNLRSRPSANANVLGSLPSGSTLDADAIDPTSAWLRVLFNGAPAWVSREVIQDADTSTLPVLEGEQRTPMQAFTFTTGIGAASCQDAPDALLVQGPEGIEIDITANGADIRIGSTIMLQTIVERTDANGNPVRMLRLITISGAAYLGNLMVPAGFEIFAPVDEEGSVIGPWEEMQPLSPDELAALRWVSFIPENILNYPLDPPTQEEIALFIRQVTGGGSVSGPASGQADCSSFQLTSPLTGAGYGVNTFYWNAAPGATSYRVNVYNQNGGLTSSFNTEPPNTSVTGDAGGAGEFSLSWDVQAFVNGQLACSTARVTMPRSAQTPIPPSTPVVCLPRPDSCPVEDSFGYCEWSNELYPGTCDNVCTCYPWE